MEEEEHNFRDQICSIFIAHLEVWAFFAPHLTLRSSYVTCVNFVENHILPLIYKLNMFNFLIILIK